MVASDDGFASQHNSNMTEIYNYGGYGSNVILASGGHSNTVWDSAFSWRGVDSNNNILMWFLGQGGEASIIAPKVPVYPQNITDWSGYWSGGGNGSNIRPDRLFDSITTDEFAKGPLRPTPIDSAWGWSFDVDIDSVDLKHIRFYDKRGYDDSVYFCRYINFGNIDTLIRYKSNGAAGWKQYNFTSKPTGRIFISFKRTIDANFMTELTEVEFYGDPVGGSFSGSPVYSGGYRKRTLASKMGVKNVLENQVSQVSPIATKTSVYRNANWFDSDNLPYPQNRIDRTPSGNLNLFSYPTALAAAGVEMWFSNRGANAYATTQGLDGDYGWGINDINSSRWNFSSYTRVANMWYMIAGVLGPTAVPTSKIRYKAEDGAIVTGTNKHTRFQHLNEPDGYFRPSRHNIRELAMQLNMVWDGYESRYGDTMGIHNASSSVQLIGPALAYPDTNTLRSLLRITRDMRTDRANIMKYVDFHDYITEDTLEVVPTVEQLQISCGTYPEKRSKNIYNRLVALSNVVYRHDTAINIIYGEWGWDRVRQCTQQLGVVPYTQSPYNVPAAIGSITDSTILQGILTERMMNIVWASPIDETHIYWMQDIGVDNTTITFGSMGLLNSANVPYPAYYKLAQMKSQFGGYKLKEVVATYADSLYQFLYEKEGQPDSLLVAIWMGNINGSEIIGKSISFGGYPIIGSAQKVVLNNNSYTPTVSTPATGATTVPNQTITETVTYYRAKVSLTLANRPDKNRIKGRIKIRH
jgi:hypothetical protein